LSPVGLKSDKTARKGLLIKPVKPL